VAADRKPSRPVHEVAGLYEAYEATKRRRRLCDFDDLLWWCADAIARDEEFAAAQRWRFRHLFVDEFQDATPLQVHLVRAWLGGRDDLCVVGDPAQAIYGFAGADSGPLRAFAAHFPGGATVAIDRNYRSTPQVLGLSVAALDAHAAGDRLPVHAVRPDGAAPTVRGYADGAAEATAVAQACWKAFARGVPWPAMSVLFRTNAQSSLFEAAFVRRGVPFRVIGADRFVDRRPVRALLDRLRDGERARPGRAFTDHVADLASDVDDDRDTEVDLDVEEHRDALLALAREYLAADGGGGTLAGFVSWLDLATRADDGGAPGVDLLTFHRAKGLEWQIVFVTGLERGLVPISWAGSPPALAEERRLLHVALGRARDEVHCSWAHVRPVNGRRIPREPSPWLEDLEARAARVAVPSVDPQLGLAGMRASLAASTPPAPRPRAQRRHR
jgi:DNA helicase-2/ATP-dependent DNA helicase PcrA